jgi:hypothetical protein
LKAILGASEDRPRTAQVLRIAVRETDGVEWPRITLAPGDRLIIENRTRRTLHVAPLDFFGNAFGRHVLEAGEATPPLVVQGLWFQVELHVDGRNFYPLDVYLAPNRAQV